VKHTSNLIANTVKMDLLVQLGGRRLTNELKLLLSEENPAPAIKRMHQYNLLPFLHPEISYSPTLERLLEEIRSVLAWYDLSFIKNGCDRWLVYLLALADPLDVKELEEFCHRMEFPPRLTNWLLEGKKEAISVAQEFYRKSELKPSEVYHLLEDLSSEWLLFIMAKTQREDTRRAISLYFSSLKDVRSKLSGKDLKSMGIEPGPVYRRILDELLDGRLDGELSSREEEIEFVRRHYMDTRSYQGIGELRK
jgi:tRNA nucleotidyltransferase (CCA-adding enzyme)